MSGMFVLQGDGLVEMTEQPYGTEAVLQELLAKHPNLPFAAFGDPDKLEQLLAVLNWYHDEVRRA